MMKAVKIYCKTCQQVVMIKDVDTGKERCLDSKGHWVECATETLYLSCGHYLEYAGDPDNGGML